MSDLRQETVDTYNHSAKELAEYFKGIGARTDDIKLAFEIAGWPENAKVLEIGCGDGRDAVEILKLTPNYLGVDISEGLIDIAKQKVPEGRFVVADIVDHPFPEDTDIIFAFASLLHLNKNEVKSVCRKVYDSLKPGGVFYVSTKSMPAYTEQIKEDDYGRRLFYFYDDNLFLELAGSGFEVKKKWHKVAGHTDWLELVLQKRP